MTYTPDGDLVLRVEREVSVSHGERPRVGEMELGPVHDELEEGREEGEPQSITAVVGSVGHEY